MRYSEHVLRKFVANGYDRIEFRALLTRLREHDAKGALVKEHDEAEFGRAFD